MFSEFVRRQFFFLSRATMLINANSEILGRRIMNESVDFEVKFACVKLMLEVLSLNRRLAKRKAISSLSFFPSTLQQFVHLQMFFSEEILSGLSNEKVQHKDVFRFIQSISPSIQETYTAFQVKIKGRIVPSEFVFLVVSEIITIYAIAPEANFPTQIGFKTASVGQIKVYDEPCDTEDALTGAGTSIMTIHLQPNTTVKYGFVEVKAVPDVQIRCLTSKVDELADAIDEWQERIEKLGEAEFGLAAIPGEILNLSARYTYHSSVSPDLAGMTNAQLNIPNEVAHEKPVSSDRFDSPAFEDVPLDASLP